MNQIRFNSHNFCALCEQPRRRFVDCNVFRSNTPYQQTDAIRKLDRCFTCLAPMHRSDGDCRYRRRYRLCNRSHHTMLACVPLRSPSVANENAVYPHSSLNPNANEF